jgi:hypothetical protein
LPDEGGLNVVLALSAPHVAGFSNTTAAAPDSSGTNGDA